MGIIVWIGWTVPQRQNDSELDGQPGQIANIALTEIPAATALATIPASPIGRQSKALPRAQTGKLDLNRATVEDLESLPGIGSVLASRIMEFRQSIGSFRSVEDLRDVKGIGKKKFEKIRSVVQVTAPKPPVQDGKKTT
jgi:competence protein ComEA